MLEVVTAVKLLYYYYYLDRAWDTQVNSNSFIRSILVQCYEYKLPEMQETLKRMYAFSVQRALH